MAVFALEVEDVDGTLFVRGFLGPWDVYLDISDARDTKELVLAIVQVVSPDVGVVAHRLPKVGNHNLKMLK